MQYKIIQIDKIKVDSDAAEAIGYSKEYKILRVWYTGGGVYDYFNVPESKFNYMLNDCPSIGVYLNEIIKPSYKYEEISSKF